MIVAFKKLLLSTGITLLISGCATSNLSYKNEQLSLQINKSRLQLHGTLLEQQKNNFSTLFLTQNLLRLDDGSMMVYESAKTDLEYQFEPTTTRTIDVIFDAKRVVKVYYNAHLYAFQVILKDNRVLNVLVSQGFDQKLKMVYGMSTEKLERVLKKLDPNAPPAYYKNVINLDHEPQPIMSQWSTWKVHFSPLVVPLPRFGYM